MIRNPEHYKGPFRTPERTIEEELKLPGSLWEIALPEVEVRDLEVYEAIAVGGGR